MRRHAERLAAPGDPVVAVDPFSGRLIAAGLSGTEIADRLLCGRETVKSHVSSLL